jgi:hypothetical protein
VKRLELAFKFGFKFPIGGSFPVILISMQIGVVTSLAKAQYTIDIPKL